MKRLLTILVFLFSINSSAQYNLDSLWSIWNNTNLSNSDRLTALNDYAWEGYLFNQPDSAFYFAQIVYDYSKNISDSNYMGRSRNTQGASFYVRGMLDSALKYYNESISLFENTSDSLKVVDIYNNVAVIYFHKGDYFNSLAIYQRNLKIQIENSDKEGIGLSYNNIGMIYHKAGNYMKALDNYFEALKIGEAINDDYLQSTTFDNLGMAFFDQKKFKESLNYLNKCLYLQLKNNNKSGTAEVYINIGRIHEQQGDLNKALELYEKSHSISSQNELGLRAAKALNRIGFIYYMKKDYEKAMDFFLKSKSDYEEIGNKQQLAEVIINISRVNLQLGKEEIAEENIQKAMKLANDIGSLNEIKSSAKLLHDLHKKAGNYKKALEAHEYFHKLRDSIINEENSKKIIEKQFQYDYEKRTLSDSIKHANEILIQQAETRTQKQRSNGLIVISILILVSLGLVFFQLRRVRSKKAIIEEKQNEIINSITYAKKIQKAILPEDKLMQEYFAEYFVLFQPKDIVGGDFYWYRSFGDKAVIACVDCTGHGVPGGFMSMMGSLLLDKIVQNEQLSTGEILGQLSDEIIRVLKQDTGGEIQDGMDLSLCVVDKKKKELLFSGARNGIYIIDNGEVDSHKADILPAGGAFSRKSKKMNRDFNTKKIQLRKDTWVVMYTDGYADQLGEGRIKSMGSSKFKKILKNALKDRINSRDFLINEFNSWKGDISQVDDVLVIGFKV